MNKLNTRQLLHLPNWIAGLQWFFFIFANIIVIPITIGEAFQLSQEAINSMMQFSFIVTGLACIAQAFFGHKRPIMEGQSGLWWGIFLTLVTTATAQGMPLHELGGSLAVGVMVSGAITIFIGVTGLGPQIAKLFNPGVMSVFVLLLGFTLIQIFLKGMLGIPFGITNEEVTIQLPTAVLAMLIAIFVIVISIKSRPQIRSYALLIGMVVGWILHVLFFGVESKGTSNGTTYMLFPLGPLTWNTGVVLTAVLAGLLNLTNTFGALKGSDQFYGSSNTKREYATSLSITGITNIASGFFGLVPYSPYVSAIGFLRQTQIFDRLPFIIGGFLFFFMGLIPPIGMFFTHLPLSIGSAVLFVAYLQLFMSSYDFLKQITLHSSNVYRVAIPIFIGAIIMTFPPNYFASFPVMLQPFLSNGLLVGIVLAIVLENVINWEKITK